MILTTSLTTPSTEPCDLDDPVYLTNLLCRNGCGCQFNGLPDYRNCEVIVGYEIIEGRYGDFNFPYPGKWDQREHLKKYAPQGISVHMSLLVLSGMLHVCLSRV